MSFQRRLQELVNGAAWPLQVYVKASCSNGACGLVRSELTLEMDRSMAAALTTPVCNCCRQPLIVLDVINLGRLRPAARKEADGYQ